MKEINQFCYFYFIVQSGCFSANDEQFVEAFGIFCGIALRNVSQYEVAIEAQARAQVGNSSRHSAQKLKQEDISFRIRVL